MKPTEYRTLAGKIRYVREVYSGRGYSESQLDDPHLLAVLIADQFHYGDIVTVSHPDTGSACRAVPVQAAVSMYSVREVSTCLKRMGGRVAASRVGPYAPDEPPWWNAR